MRKSLISTKLMFCTQFIFCVIAILHYTGVLSNLAFIEVFAVSYIVEKFAPVTISFIYVGSIFWLGWYVAFSDLRDRESKNRIPKNINRYIVSIQSIFGCFSGILLADCIYYASIGNNEQSYAAFIYYLFTMLLVLGYVWIFDSVLVEKHKITQNMFGTDMRKGFRVLGVVFMLVPVVTVIAEAIKIV